MRRRCCTHPFGNATKQGFKSASAAHLSVADLVCATSQQHFRGQETASKTEGDSGEHGSFQADGRQNYNILAPGRRGMGPVTQMSLCWGRCRPCLGSTDPPHTATAGAAGVDVLLCFRGAALCLWMANLGGFLFTLCTWCWSHIAESQPWWCRSSSFCFSGAKNQSCPSNPRVNWINPAHLIWVPHRPLCWQSYYAGGNNAKWSLLFFFYIFSIFLTHVFVAL